MISMAFTAVLIVVPVIAIAFEWGFGSTISEHHYRDHDVYTVSHSLSRIPVVIMVLMGLLGVILGWLSDIGVFVAREALLLSFFAAFVIVLFVMWTSLRRYRVTTYESHMKVRPFFGLTRIIPYKDIELMRWTNMRNLMGGHNVAVYVRGRVATVLMSAVDLDQILLRVNRDDAIDRD